MSNHGWSTRSSRASSGSSQSGPTPKAPQSRNTIEPSGRCSRLSSRMSPVHEVVDRLRRQAASAGARSARRSRARAAPGRRAARRVARIDSPSPRRPSPRSHQPGPEQRGPSCGPRSVGGAAGRGTRSLITATSSSVAASSRVHGGVVVEVGVAPLDVLEQEHDPVAALRACVVRRQQLGPQRVRAEQAEGQHLAAEEGRGVGVELGAHRLDERPGAVGADHPRGAPGGEAADLLVEPATTGEPSASSTQCRTCSGIAAYGAPAPDSAGGRHRATSASPTSTPTHAARTATPSTPRPARAGGRAGRATRTAPGRRRGPRK